MTTPETGKTGQRNMWNALLEVRNKKYFQDRERDGDYTNWAFLHLYCDPSVVHRPNRGVKRGNITPPYPLQNSIFITIVQHIPLMHSTTSDVTVIGLPVVDKPARLIIRLLFGFGSDSETSAVTPWERVRNLWWASAQWKLVATHVFWWISPPTYVN